MPHAGGPADTSPPVPGGWHRRMRALLSGAGLILAGYLSVTLLVPRPAPAPAPEPRVAEVLADLRPTEPGEPAQGARPSETATPQPPEPAKVDQIIAALREGRRPASSGDDPNAGAPAILASFGRDADFTVGTITIPDIGLEATYRTGVHESAVNQGPGHWPGTPLPGMAGNSVMSGHRTTFTRPFHDLDLLAPGDEVVTTLGPHDAVTYRVTDTAIVPESEYVEYVLAQPRHPDARTITLFACHPKGDRSHRIVVQARAEPITQPPPPADEEGDRA